MKSPVQRAAWFASFAAALLWSCAPSEDPVAPPGAEGPAISFVEVGEASGLLGPITAGANPPREILEVKGGGLALIDYDKDGRFDVFVPNGSTLDRPAQGAGARLWRNGGGLRFAETTREVGLEFSGWGMGVAVGDVHGDGYDDLYVAAFGPDALLANGGGRRFSDQTEAAGLGSSQWGTGCAFGDLDRDGDLDLFLVHYLEFDPKAPPPAASFLGVETFGGPMGLPAVGDRVYENDGRGRFRDVTEESGVGRATARHGLGVLVVDLDDDGWLDVYVGNDSMPNQLFRNLGGLRFEEVAAEVGLATNGDGAAQATMGLVVLDADGDRRADIFSTNFSDDTNTLWVQAAGMGLRFRDLTRAYGLGLVSRPFLGWAAVAGDLDRDGAEDLVVVNGHVYGDPVAQRLGSSRAQAPLLFRRSDARFERVEPGPQSGLEWLSARHPDRSAVLHDFDGDGDLDLLVLAIGEPLRLLENRSPSDHRSIQVELRDQRPGIGNFRGFGARLELSPRGEEAAPTQVRWLATGGSYLAAGAPVAHFGLGAGVGPFELTVRWPDGLEQRVAVEREAGRILVERP